MSTDEFMTAGGLTVERERHAVDPAALDDIADALDERRGMVLASDTEYPGRYTPWRIGFVDPPLCLTARGREVSLTALNDRGRLLLPVFGPALRQADDVAEVREDGTELTAVVRTADACLAEEGRSRRPSAFSVLRVVCEVLGSSEDEYLGLHGAFGYDLAFQFEPARLRLERPADQRDLVLYLPDELVVVDPRRGVAERRRYEFRCDGGSTRGLRREGPRTPWTSGEPGEPGAGRGLPPGRYADLVREARHAFQRGDLFEVVLSQTFSQGTDQRPAELFRRLREANPSPYGFLVSLGEGEHLVGVSPEMYVRVTGRRLETCPLSGTVPRGEDAVGDADQIRTLLNSAKDESELTMCTDVDRNDKARICEPGSVQVIGRRQIELYSRLIHTADHVTGVLRKEYDGLDALLAHTWAVTVTGAPKAWATQYIEDHEPSVRRWYGGAVGHVGFNGDVNTGLAIRMAWVKSGRAEVRVGATLLFDSVPEQEERETELKASALLSVLRRDEPPGRDEPGHAGRTDTGAAPSGRAAGHRPLPGPRPLPRRLVLADHQDSFVHTLADYFRQAGADVRTLRAPLGGQVLADERPDLLVLSPGPGRPADFGMSATLGAALGLGIPVFGVCLGLQAVVEYFGGTLSLLPQPVHGKTSWINVTGGRLLAELPKRFAAGRYHSIFAAQVPECLEVTATTDEGVVMAVEHRSLPVAAVQFHPESILTLRGGVGHGIVEAVLRGLLAN
ncbi:anthranilate synthase component I [Streptomyces sp. NPDC059568]|uniref:anthranilate synthase component I n=1 Tax=Streptomyces sp. NPDC059568 TaxID=3346868 RepID=UPI0036AF88E0